MRIKHVHIENFRCLQQLDVDVQAGANVLIGENNTGKTAFLHALNHALGRGGPAFEIEDFFVEDPEAGTGALEPIVIDLELRPMPNPAFSGPFVTEFASEIDFDSDDKPYLTFRTQANFDTNEGAIRVEYAAVKSDGTARPMSARKRFTLRGFIPFYLADAFRDTVRELRTRRGFWGQLIDSALLDATTEATVTQALREINDSILASTPRFSEIRERFREIGLVIPTVPSPDDVILNPLTADPSAVLKNPEILLRTIDAPRGFALDRHGEGTRSVGYLVIFRAFVDLLAKEENDNTEAEPVIGIEEPEAHLHLHARRGIANILSDPDKQAFITSHSTAIAQRVSVDNITLFRRDGVGCVATQVPTTSGTGEQPFFEPRQRTTLQRELRSGAAEALFSRAVLLFEGESEVRALPFFASAAGIELDLRGISFVSVDGQAFSPLLRLFGSRALKIPWVILTDGENPTGTADHLVKAGVVSRDAVDTAVAANRLNDDILLPNDVFVIGSGHDLEAAMIFSGARTEYEAAIAEHCSPGELERFVNGESSRAALSAEEQVVAFMDHPRWGRRWKILFAGIVAEAVTVGGTDPTRTPPVIAAALSRVTDFASGAAKKAWP